MGSSEARGGPLADVRVLEIAHEHTAFAARLLADLGADVVVVEPPGGHATRRYGPFAGDEPGPERSLWWWHYNTDKRSITLDLDDPADRRALRDLAAEVDILVEGEAPGRVAEIIGERPERLIHVAITPLGQQAPVPPVTDLTMMAAGGMVWSSGYDDHSLPPVRAGGGQSLHTAGHFAVMAALVALTARRRTGRGQFVDVSIHAAVNVTTERATFEWLVVRGTVQRQTGRHAWPYPTEPLHLRCADGRVLDPGAGARRSAEFAALVAWLEELGVADEFADVAVLRMGIDVTFISGTDIQNNPLEREIFQAGRAAIAFLATKLPAYELFVGLQRRGLAAGIVYAPEEVLADPHFVSREFSVTIAHEEWGDVVHPGAAIRFAGRPRGPRRRAPRIGEHGGVPVFPGGMDG